MHVAIDLKNLALYAGGIVAFARPLVAAWLAHRPDFRFSLVAPDFDTSDFAHSSNWTHVNVNWPSRLPRSLRHPFYDTVLFPRAVAKLRPQFVFSFYHDVLLPARSSGIVSATIVHDTCLDDLPHVYPPKVRLYYLALLRANLKRATHLLTVSDTSRALIMDRYGVSADRVSVIYNPIDPEFATGRDIAGRAQAIRARYAPARILFYPGGSDYRKNLPRLFDALDRLGHEGRDVRLLATGDRNDGWTRAMQGRNPSANNTVTFLGRLSARELETYYAAADAVVYPTLCEGFGRVCLEAMMAGAPIACSDLPVLREVASDYPCYVNPLDTGSIVDGIERALVAGRRTPRRDPRFAAAHVESAFVQLMDRLTDGIESSR